MFVVSALSRRAIAALTVCAAAAGLMVAAQSATAPNAHADTAPAAGTPATFSADPLPTVQTDGIVWANTTVAKSNVTFATGNFNFVRPAGMAPSAAHIGQTQVGGIVAFNTSTGVQVPLTTLKPPTLNGPGYAIAASPDGSTIYVGGSFTTANGVAHGGIVAFNAATGAIVPFKAQLNGEVDSLAVTATTVYAGGKFLAANGVARTRLAAFTVTKTPTDPTNGALTAWDASADGTVSAMVLTPDGTRLIVGGHFAHLSSTATNVTSAPGMGALSATTAAPGTWIANLRIQDGGPNGAIDTLSTDGKLIYGGGYASSIGGENFEGRFAADPLTGKIDWVDDCFGDTYATLPVNGVLYSAGHEHDCSQIGAFPDANNPNSPVGEWHRVIAETTTPSGGANVEGDNNRGGAWNNFIGTPDAKLLDWFPTQTPAPLLASQAVAGTVSVSGAQEAGWNLSSDGNYLVVGGEMSSAGDPAAVSYLPNQQSLVRYAVHPLAPNKVGPFFNSVAAPTITAGAPGSAQIIVHGAWDRDNQNLTYNLYRDGASTPFYTTSMSSTFWQPATNIAYDNGLGSGTHTYVLKVSDPDGNFVKVAASVVITNGVAAPARAFLGADLALNKPATESSVVGAGFEAAKAVDGNLDGNQFDIPSSMAITGDTVAPWWQVDLGKSQPIAGLNIVGNIDGPGNETSDYWVFVSNTPFNTALTPTQQAAVKGVWSVYEAGAAGLGTKIIPPAGATGRYVMIQHGAAKSNTLALAEVQIYAS
jgi:hypothetical protein